MGFESSGVNSFTNFTGKSPGITELGFLDFFSFSCTCHSCRTGFEESVFPADNIDFILGGNSLGQIGVNSWDVCEK